MVFPQSTVALITPARMVTTPMACPICNPVLRPYAALDLVGETAVAVAEPALDPAAEVEVEFEPEGVLNITRQRPQPCANTHHKGSFEEWWQLPRLWHCNWTGDKKVLRPGTW